MMRLGASSLFTLMITIILLVFLVGGLGYERKAWIYPTVAALPSFIFVLIQLYRDLRGLKGEERTLDLASDHGIPSNLFFKRGARFWGWILGLYAMIWFVGFKAGMLFFLVFFLRIEGKLKGFIGWLKITFLTGIMLFIMLVQYEQIFGVRWPKGWIESYIPLSSYLTLPF